MNRLYFATTGLCVCLASGALAQSPKNDKDTDPFEAVEDFFGTQSPPKEQDSDTSEKPFSVAEVASGPSSDNEATSQGNSFMEALTDVGQAIGTWMELESGEEPEQSRVRGPEQRIEMVKGFERGRQLALLEKRPLLVVFGADWCTWCRQLEEELASEDADKILRHWMLTKVDVDREQEIASKYSVNSLPSLRIIDANGEVIASRTGYAPVPDLEEWLGENLQQADPVLQAVLFDNSTPDSEDIKKLIGLLSQRSIAIRAAAGRRLIAHRSASAGPVVDLLRRGSLSAQLSALEILEQWKAPTSGLDPWQPDTLNSDSTAALIEWLRDLPVGDPKNSETSQIERSKSGPQDSSDPNVGDPNQVLIELIQASPSRAAELFERAVSYGEAAALEAKRIELTVDSLDDDARMRLRRVRYSVLAGNATRLEHAGLIELLAQLDGPTHRSAAEKLAPVFTSQDQPLIEELSSDRDAMVREFAVEAFHHVGALNEGDHLQRLLADESPSVRTAVLRQLTRDPSDDVTIRLIEYLESETDEDLLIYATKTLGMLSANEKAIAALADLIDHERWRVRAAALDAVGEFLQKSHYQWMGDDEDEEAGSNEAIADAVIRHTSDEDAFVAEKAQFLLPQLISERTAETIANFLLADHERSRRVLDTVDEFSRERQIQPLIDLCVGWLEGSDSEQVSNAALLMTQVAPTTLRYRLDDLLGSDEAPVRMAALRAIFPCLADFRESGIKEDLENWKLALSSPVSRQVSEISLIRPVPESFELLSTSTSTNTDPKIETSDRPFPMETLNLGSESEDGLDVFDFFGGTSKTSDHDERSDQKTDAEVFSDAEADEKDANSDGDLTSLDLAESLFGSAPSVHEAIHSTQSDIGSKIDLNRLGLGSYWMQRWQTRTDETIRRPTWIRSCLPILQRLADSDDSSERYWARAALMACGDAERWSGQTESQPEEREDFPSVESWVSWLPEASRHQWIRDHAKSIDSEDSNFSLKEAWQEATSLDLFDSASYINKLLTGKPQADVEHLVPIARSLSRLLFGSVNESEVQYLTTSELVRMADEPLAERKTIAFFPDQKRVVEWLIEQYRSSDHDAQRAVVLTVLNQASRRHGIAESLAVLEESQHDSVLLGVALAMALSDLDAMAADRAVVLLDHPVPRVVDEALIRLASKHYHFAGPESPLLLETVYSDGEALFGLQQVQRSLPKVTLQQLSESDRGSTAAIAKIMLLSRGEPVNPQELLKETTQIQDSLLLIAIACATAGRTDEAAIELYKRCADSLETYELVPIRIALSSIKDDRVRQITKRMSQNSNSFSW